MLTDPDRPFDKWQTEIRAKDMGSACAQCEALQFVCWFWLLV